MRPQPTPRLPPTALASREPTQPEGMCSATLSGNKPAAAERPQGPVRGTARGGLSLSSGTKGGWWGARSGAWGNLQLPCSGTCGPGASARWHVHHRTRTRCCGGPVPHGAGIDRRGRRRAGHPTQPRKRHEQTERGRDGAPCGHCHVPPAARPSAGPLPH